MRSSSPQRLQEPDRRGHERDRSSGMAQAARDQAHPDVSLRQRQVVWALMEQDGVSPLVDPMP